VSGQHHTPPVLYLRYPLNRRLGGPQGIKYVIHHMFFVTWLLSTRRIFVFRRSFVRIKTMNLALLIEVFVSFLFVKRQLLRQCLKVSRDVMSAHQTSHFSQSSCHFYSMFCSLKLKLSHYTPRRRLGGEEYRSTHSRPRL
jgi:hypothetical protein